MEIHGYTDYLIYNDGRVFSKFSNKFLKPGTNGRTGYKFIKLSNDNKQGSHTIHRLIALHYINNPENKRCVDHINRIKSDNRVENLRWVTHSENKQNQSKRVDNKSGHKYISYNKSRDRWAFKKTINKKKTHKLFKTKTDALCYKFIFILINQ